MRLEEFDYQFKRKSFLLHDVAMPILSTYFMISGSKPKYEGLENLKELTDGPFFVCPNHQEESDIPLVGKTLIDGNGRLSYFIMGESLNEKYVYLGGIPNPRGKDFLLRRSEYRDKDGEIIDELYAEFKNEIEEARKKRDRILFNTLARGIERGEAMFVFPQGGIKRGVEFMPDKRVLNRMIEGQKLAGREIPVVPVKISYENWNSKLWGTKVDIKVGKPRKFGHNDIDGLNDYLIDNIR
jgi:1-acyl-sn-glycerol-3-phosphate acyltransferase